MIHAALMLAALLIAQTGKPPQRASIELGPAYVDGHFGFSIQPPKGWQLSRQREQPDPVPRDSHGNPIPEQYARRPDLTILRMYERTASSMMHEIRLQQSSDNLSSPVEDENKRISDKLQSIHHALAAEFNDVELGASQSQRVAGRPGGFLSATFQSEGMAMLRLHAIVEVRPAEYYMLVYQGPASLRDRSEPLFARVLGSFNLLPDAFDQATVRRALQDGIHWINDLMGRKRLLESLEQEVYFKLEADGKPVGFVAVAQAEQLWKGKHEGLETRERGWTFGEHGAAQRLQSNAFVSFDLRHEYWKTRNVTYAPGAKDRPPLFNATTEDAIREDSVLLSNQSYRLDEPVVENSPRNVPPAYLSRALVRMVPRMLENLDKPRLLAYAGFDHNRVDLVIQLLELKGAEVPPNTATRGGKTYRIDVRDGLAGEPARTYVDEKGRVLLVQAGSMSITRSSREALEREFGPRVQEAERNIAQMEKAYREETGRFDTRPPAPKKKKATPAPQPARPPR
jgi:hypothetical protein